MFTIGVAGHVDHGKTALVKALTGIDTDRLEEEKRRGLTIDIGFAPVSLPGGAGASFVDVPGHEKFIKNMLAGATGIDVLLLVVAADDGVMPQTTEHLLIAKLLGIEAVVGAITKIDAVEPDQVSAVVEEVGELLASTGFGEAPVLALSAWEGTGLDALTAALSDVVAGDRRPPPDRPLRMPVDRVFAAKGSGTVVTGTMWEGSVGVGDTVSLHPGGKSARVRNLQVHGESVKTADGHGRLAINLAGVEKDELGRGAMVLAQGAGAPSVNIYALVSLLPAASTLKTGARLRLFHGTAQCEAKLAVQESSKLGPGQTGVCRLRLSEELVMAPLDRFVLRQPGGRGTIGGGVVIDPWRPSGKMTASVAEALLGGRPEERLVAWLEWMEEPLSAAELAVRLRVGDSEIAALAKGTGKVVALSEHAYAMAAAVHAWELEIVAYVGARADEETLYRGTPADELAQKCLRGLSAAKTHRVIDYLLSSGKLAKGESGLVLPGRSITEESAGSIRLLELIRAASYSSPPVDMLAAAAGLSLKEARAALARLRDGGKLLEIAGLFYDAETIGRAGEMLRSELREKGSISVSDFRQLLGTTRKHALPILEYFDRKDVSRRQGEVRVAGRG